MGSHGGPWEPGNPFLRLDSAGKPRLSPAKGSHGEPWELKESRRLLSRFDLRVGNQLVNVRAIWSDHGYQSGFFVPLPASAVIFAYME